MFHNFNSLIIPKIKLNNMCNNNWLIICCLEIFFFKFKKDEKNKGFVYIGLF